MAIPFIWVVESFLTQCGLDWDYLSLINESTTMVKIIVNNVRWKKIDFGLVEGIGYHIRV